jgi:hypothetical protein
MFDEYNQPDPPKDSDYGLCFCILYILFLGVMLLLSLIFHSPIASKLIIITVILVHVLLALLAILAYKELK